MKRRAGLPIADAPKSDVPAVPHGYPPLPDVAVAGELPALFDVFEDDEPETDAEVLTCCRLKYIAGADKPLSLLDLVLGLKAEGLTRKRNSRDRKSTCLNSSHNPISHAVFRLR